jgi:hypothetical protein
LAHALKISALLFLAVFLVLGCGDKPGPKINVQLTYSSDNPFQDAAVKFVRVRVLSLVTDGKVLDTDKNGVQDSFGFPENCINGGSFKSGCGFDPAAVKFELGGIPLNFNYEIWIEFWDQATASLLYEGTTQFANTDATQLVTVTVDKK